MNLLLALLLVQAPPIETTVDAFVKGDKEAEAALVKHGVFAIRPLQKARDRNPQTVDALIFQLKKAAAHPASLQVVANLDFSKACMMQRDARVDSNLVRHIEGFAGPSFIDLIDHKLLKSATFRLKHDQVRARDILDDFCRQTGLDYGFFHNFLVIGHPERLWPSNAPAPVRKLTDEETALAKKLIEQMAAESLEEREAASRELTTLGPAVVPMLKEALVGAEAEQAARCSTLLLNLEVRPAARFGPSGAVRQTRSVTETKVLMEILSGKMDFDFRTLPFATVLEHMAETWRLELEVAPEARRPAIRQQFREQRLIDVLSLMTQSRDLDFMLRDRRLIVDTRDSIDRQLPR